MTNLKVRVETDSAHCDVILTREELMECRSEAEVYRLAARRVAEAEPTSNWIQKNEALEKEWRGVRRAHLSQRINEDPEGVFLGMVRWWADALEEGLDVDVLNELVEMRAVLEDREASKLFRELDRKDEAQSSGSVKKAKDAQGLDGESTTFHVARQSIMGHLGDAWEIVGGLEPVTVNWGKDQMVRADRLLERVVKKLRAINQWQVDHGVQAPPPVRLPMKTDRPTGPAPDAGTISGMAAKVHSLAHTLSKLAGEPDLMAPGLDRHRLAEVLKDAQSDLTIYLRQLNAVLEEGDQKEDLPGLKVGDLPPYERGAAWVKELMEARGRVEVAIHKLVEQIDGTDLNELTRKNKRMTFTTRLSALANFIEAQRKKTEGVAQ